MVDEQTFSGIFPCNFAYITKSGKIINETDEFKKGCDYYNKFINNDRYYVNDTFNIVLFIILYTYSIFGLFITLLCGNDMDEYFGPEKNNLIRGRNMRINHFKIFLISEIHCWPPLRFLCISSLAISASSFNTPPSHKRQLHRRV